MAERYRLEDGEARRSGSDGYREGTDAADEVRIKPYWRSGDFDLEIAVQDLFPKDAQLHLGQPIADAAMDSGAKRKMLAHLGALDIEGLGVGHGTLVAVARDVPHHDFCMPRDR